MATMNSKAVNRLSHILDQYEEENLVRDILTDLRHWCDAHNLDFANEDRIAYINYRTELEQR